MKEVFEEKGKDWEEKKLKEIFHIGSSKRIREKDWTTSGVPFYGGKEIVKLSKFGSVVSNAYISDEKYNEYALKYDMPQQGDILITARGTIGVGYIVQKDDKFYYKDGNIISMRAKTPTNPRFILYALKSNAIYDQLKKLTGATVTHLPIERAKELVLMIPNYSTQNFFVNKIEEIEAKTLKLDEVYQKKIADLEFNCTSTDSVIIGSILPSPNDFLKKTDSICSYQKLEIAAAGIFDQYQWSTGAVGSKINIDNPGSYWLKVTDANGCTGTDSISVYQKECMSGIHFPNAFTPNNDGRNDIFKPLVFGKVVSFKLQIFDRAGQLIFETTDPLKGWNGSYKGKNFSTTAFVWQCAYQFENQKQDFQKGAVFIIR